MPAAKKKPAKAKPLIDRNSPPRTVSIQQAANELGVSYATISGWIENNKIGYQELEPRDPKSTHKLRRIPWTEVLRVEKESYKPPKLTATSK